MIPVQQAFDLALQHHQAGRLAEAEALYRQVLAVQPNHPDGLHLLGVLFYQTGRNEGAVEWIQRSLAIDSSNPSVYSNLGEIFRTLGRLEESMTAFRHALQLEPNHAEAHSNLGNAHRERGELDEALAACRRALELRPGFPQALVNLGNAFMGLENLSEAIKAYRAAIRQQPNHAEAHNNLGLVLARRGEIDEALDAYRHAALLKPDLVHAHYNEAVTLAQLGRFDEAIAVYRRAIALKPDYVEAHNNLGNALRERFQLKEAIVEYTKALELNPNYVESLNNLALALRDQGHLEKAISALRQAIELRPSFAEAHDNLSIVLRERGHLDEAIAASRRALQLKPDLAQAYDSLGNLLKDQGDIDEAVKAYRRALDFAPFSVGTHSDLIYALHHQPSHDGGTVAEEYQRWNRQFAEPLKPTIVPHNNDRNPDRRLRIGYVSPNFCAHVVGLNVLSLFNYADPLNFEVLCYAAVRRPDRFTEAFRRRALQWREIVGVADNALAELIRRDGVDILVDLSQHTVGNRLPLFARQPAPVQVSFAGYPESAGIEGINYRISDGWMEKCGVRTLDGGIESILNGHERVFLIDSFWCYDPCGVHVEINALPAKTSGHLTFGCLNNFCKVNKPLLKLWARVLGQVQGSRLVMLSRFGSHRQRALEFLAWEGVEAQRVEFVEPRPRQDYLEFYHRLDIVLDTFPYNGHTTSLDALWMGVPVVSLCGERAVSRAGLSQLSNLGLPELVACSEDDYVNIAVELANDLPRLAELRRTLRGRMEASVLMDAPRFARQIEAAYRAMWRHWCAEETAK